MRTLGIDLAAQPKDTAVCEIEWLSNNARVVVCECNCTDGRLKEAISAVDKVGIDIPLGWPEPFVLALRGHLAFDPWPSLSPQELRLRATDRHVQTELKINPLSVAADRISIPAMRAAGLLSNLDPMARDGSEKVIEIYPQQRSRSGASGIKNTRVRNTQARDATSSRCF